MGLALSVLQVVKKIIFGLTSAKTIIVVAFRPKLLDPKDRIPEPVQPAASFHIDAVLFDGNVVVVVVVVIVVVVVVISGHLAVVVCSSVVHLQNLVTKTADPEKLIISQNFVKSHGYGSCQAPSDLRI